MQEEQDHQKQVGCKNIQNHMQIIIKGKRTKRQRLPSPLRLTMSTSSPSLPSKVENNTTENSGTTSSLDNIKNKEEEEDMANCLILLAQGHHVVAPINTYFYQCKTCNRCFPSFQALGGHRAGHKKPKTNTEENKTVTSFVNDHDSLTLKLSNSAMTTTTTTTTKSKVHECSICGAEFSSGQALGGHMRRHRSTSAIISNGIGSHETKVQKNVLKLDLNLPAPNEEYDERESKFLFQSKDKVFDFSANSLVDCHY